MSISQFQKKRALIRKMNQIKPFHLLLISFGIFSLLGIILRCIFGS